MNTGWICPRCQKCHAPWVPGCDCAPATITSYGATCLHLNTIETTGGRQCALCGAPVP